MGRSVVFLSSFFPPLQQAFFMAGMRSAANLSASAFSYALLAGFSDIAKERIHVVNTPLTGPFPFCYNRLFSRACLTEEYGASVHSIGMCNLYGIQGISMSQNAFAAIKKQEVGDADILVYSIQLPLLQAAVHYKKLYKKSRIILVVPDLLEDISNLNTLAAKVKAFLFGDFAHLCQSVDAYVLLTEQMIDRMPVKRPYCVVEGIFNPSERRDVGISLSDTFTVFYSGMLYERFGVKNLIDAFSYLDMRDLRLQLCGSGDLESYIRGKAATDPRIEYLGIVPRDKALKLQCNASLLVNPRQPNGCFTCYSFPSKNIEYLASGVPALIYELEGIPQEYFNYCYHLPAGRCKTEELAKAIAEIYHSPASERMEMAKRAQAFISTQKNASVQCARILELIDNLQ